MMDLVRLSPRPILPPGGEPLYRQIASITRMEPDSEVLVVGCGPGVTVEYFAREWGVRVSGVDSDPRSLERAEARLRGSDVADRVAFQLGPSDALPYRDRIFDVAVAELTFASKVDPGAALGELLRVLRPGGWVALVQLVWKAPVDPARRELLSRHLGARPLMLVEWKRLLRAAGVGPVHTEDWSDDETAFRSAGVKPFPDFAELFSLGEKVGILRRAWGQWGWRGVRAALAREQEVHRLLTRERILGLDLLVGRAPLPAPSPSSPEAPPDGASDRPQEDPSGVPSSSRARESDPALRDLPLFTSNDDPP